METFLKTTTVTNNLFKTIKNFKLTYNCYTSLPKHFAQYNMIKFYQAIPKYISKENSTTKFKLKMRSFMLIIKAFYNIT